MSNLNMKPFVTYAIPVLAVIALLVFVAKSEPSGPAETEKTTRELAMECVTHGGISYHVHPELAIIVDGVRRPIPEGVGIDPTCMKSLHTHDTTGKIHVEYPVEKPFTLGDFFAVWGEEFSSTRIMDKVADDTHEVRLTVNGVPSTEFENLVLHDKDLIVIEYGEKK